MGTKDEIVFEDLHGVPDDEPVTVNLDADLNDDGIERSPAVQVADADGVDDDDVEFDDLPSARYADEQDDDEPAASTDDDDDNYSRRVRARIKRSTEAEKAAKQEAAYWKQQAESLAKDQGDRNRSELEAVVERTKSTISSMEAELERAIDDGDTKAQVRLTSDLTDLKAEKIQAEFELKNSSSSAVNLQPFDGRVQSTGATDQSLADKWMSDRADWYGARGFERQTRLANRLDKEVFADGYDPDSPEYFEELDRRLKEKEPTLFDDVDTGRRSRRRQPVAPVTPQPPQRRSNSSKVELDADDFANIRRFGLNPRDPQVLKEYAANKAQTLTGRR